MAEKLTRAELEKRIAEISDFLKGPGIDFPERLALNEDRRELRRRLAALDEVNADA